MTRPLVIFSFAVALGLSCAASPQSPAAGLVSVQLLAINDLHGHLEPPAGSNGRVGSVDAGGAEYLATHLRQTLNQDPRSIVVGAGDMIGASPLISSSFHNEPAIEALNAMGLSVTSVGNHEFDKGTAELLRMKRGGCHPKDGCQDGIAFTGARFDYLAANVLDKKSGQPLFPSTAVRTVGGVKIGFIGVTTIATATMVPATVGAAWDFRDEAEVANAQAAALKKQGVNAIVLLIHEGLRQQGGGEDAGNPNSCNSPSGGLERVLKALSSDITVVVSGHTHAYYNCKIGDRIVTSAGSYGRVVTHIRLSIDAKTDRISSATATNEIVTRDVPKDAAVGKIVARYGTLVTKVANEVVGSVTADLRRQGNGAGESPLGSLIADAQLDATMAPENGRAVLSFMNSGGIRSDVLASRWPEGAKAAPVTFNDLYNVHPFGNIVMAFTMTGEQIKRVLEQQFDGPTGPRRNILQVSRGFTYRYRLNTAAGQHIEAGSMMLNGKPLQPADKVRVAAVDFLVTVGDGFTVFGESTERQVVIADIDALVQYFKKHSPIAPAALGRIVRVDSPGPGPLNPTLVHWPTGR